MANLLAFFASIFYVLPKTIGKVIGLLEGAAKIIQDYLRRRAEEKAKEQLAKAVEIAEKEKNTCELERLFDPSKQCNPPK